MTDAAFNPEKCPVCRGIKIEMGYGLAGGGIGVYSYCLDCACVFDKVQDAGMFIASEDLRTDDEAAP